MKRKIIISIIIISTLGAIGWFTNIFGGKPPSGKEATMLGTVKSGPLKISVTAKGAFAPKNVTYLTVGNITSTGSSRYSRRMGGMSSQSGLDATLPPVDQFKLVKIVPEGTRVKKDDEIVTFDSAPLEARIKDLETQLTNTKESIKKAEENVESQKNSFDFNLRWDESNIQTTKKELDKYLEDYPRDVKSRGISLEQVKLGLKNLREGLVNLYEQVDEGKVAEDSPELKSKRLELEQRQISVENQEKEFKLFNDYTIPQEILKRKIEYEKSVSTKEKNRKDGEAKVKQAEREVTNAKTQIENAEKALKTAIEWRDKMVIKAPHDGFVLYGGYNPEQGWYVYSSDIQEGRTLYVGQPVINIPNDAEMKITVQLNEIEIKKMTKDLKAEIQPEAFPELVLPGKVEKVPEMALRAYRSDDYSGSSNQSYPLEITCEKSDERIKPKMTARVEILIESITNTLYVPLEAVFEKDKKTVSYVAMPDFSIQEKPVKLGKSNDDFVSIIEGLKEGEKVYLYDPFLGNK